MIKKILLLFLLLPFLSCNNKEESEHTDAWIGGEIVNPKVNFVVISKENKVIDTVKLDSRNYFMYKIHSICPGLYSIRHNEYQLMYLEPGDSLMLRVNTIEFDESLSFTGKGAEGNNLLMDYFLLNDIENSMLTTWYALSPEVFEKKLDSFRSIKIDAYNEFAAKNRPSREFREIAYANIDYDHYLKKEIYASVNSIRSTSENIEYPPKFFAYRKKVDFGNEILRSYFPYYRFLNKYFDNLAYKKYDSENPNRRYLADHFYNKVKIIDSLITNDTLKNNMLRTNVGRYLLNGKDLENSKPIVDLFLELNTNKAHQIEMSSLSKATAVLTPGSTLPNILLLDTKNMTKDIHSIINRPTVIYFWTASSVKHYRNIHFKASELSQKYPEYEFIGINTDTHFKKWRKTVELANYDSLHEYQFDNVSIAERKLVINSMNKAIIVDKYAKILQNNTSLFNRNIERELLNYLNQ